MKQITLTQGKIVLVDNDVYEWASIYKWYAKNSRGIFYAARTVKFSNKKRSTTFLHHYIVGYPLNNNEVDHMDGDGLNNQRDNLRIGSHRKNGQNRKEHRNGSKTSKYVGVSWNKARNKWLVMTQINGKMLYLGYFNDEEEANLAYQSAVKDR